VRRKRRAEVETGDGAPHNRRYILSAAGDRQPALAAYIPSKVMKTKIKWIDGVSFVGESGSGHSVVIDGAPEHGGRNIGIRPMELFLMGAVACTAFDVVHILKKARQPIVDCHVDADAERASADPKVFTKIHLRYIVAGHGLARPQVERAVKLSKEKYCSATLMLAQTAEITHEVVITEN